MQFRQDTRAELIRKVAYLMVRDKFLYGQVLASPAPTVSTFALEKAKKYPTDNFSGQVMHVVAGLGIGQEAYVDDSAVGTGVITVTPSLATTLDTTSFVELWPTDLDREAVASALNLALDDLGDVLNVYVETVSPTIDTGRRIITIPTNFVKLVDVRYRDAGGLWRVFRHSHTPENPGEEQGIDFTVAGRLVYLSTEIPSDVSIYKISGYRLAAQMLTDAALAEAPAPYLVFKAASNLEQAMTAGVELDPEQHATRGGQWLAQAQLHRPSGTYANYLPNTIILDVGA